MLSRARPVDRPFDLESRVPQTCAYYVARADSVSKT